MAYPNDPIKTAYKLYDGSNWLKYYFETSAAQVGTDNSLQFVNSLTKVNGVGFTLNSDGKTATVTINGTDITCNAVAFSGTLTPSSSSLHYINASDSIATALGKLDQAAYDALLAIPSGCLTTSNYSQTLDNVYQAKGDYQPLDDDLTAIAGLTGTSGFLKKTAANTWALDQTVYVPQTRTINNKALSSDITLGATDIGYTNSAFALANTVGSYLDTLTNVVQGKQNSYAIALSGTGTGVINRDFDTQNNDVSINATFSSISGGGYTCDKSIKTTGGTTINLATLKVGDNVYITDQEVPDRWVSEITYPSGGGVGHVTFTKLETQKVVLTSYATWGTILAHYGIGDASINTSTKVVTLGSNTIAPVVTVKVGATSYNPTNGIVELPAYPVITGLVPYSGATQNLALGQKSISGKYANFEEFDLENGTAVFSISASGDNIEMSSISGAIGVSADNFTFNSKNVATITAGTSSPSSPRIGDIWLDTN